MFTELIRKGKWSYMFLAAVAVLAVAALATLANTRAKAETESSATQQQGQPTYGSYTRYNGTTVRFVN
ncbi:MAG: hypothetical protein IKW84_06010 [Bacteroidaceae bacterium]|nr:hypothetical protein [Bacteroidaceae bacterium]